jgi:hypothetical protein
MAAKAAKADPPATQVPFSLHSQRDREYDDGATYLAIFERLDSNRFLGLYFFLV